MKKIVQTTLLFTLIAFNTIAQLANWSSGGNAAFSNFPTNVSGQINGFCRISQMKFHATDANKLYAVTGEGGFFTSNDAGSNWTVKAGTENLTGSCASLCIDYTNDQVIFLGSGDANYYSNGQGIYKSTNGGTSFVATTLTNCLVIEILQDPNNASTFVAATNKGIYKTINGGTSWVATTSTNIQFSDIKKHATANSSILFACTRDNASLFYKSTDFGSTWSLITSGITTATSFIQSGGRIGVSPADPSVVYFETIGGGGIIHKSSDEGVTFKVMKGQGAGTNANPYLTFYDFDNANGLNGQGNYNNTITVDATNASKLWLQSHNTWYSIDSGVTWTRLTYWAYVLHTDMHQIIQSPYDATKLYSCNDGGIWLSTDGGTNWNTKSNGLYAYEIYTNCGKSSRTDKNNITIGTQDNGRVYRNASGWFTDRGGDDSRQKEYDYLPNGGNYYEKTQNIKRAAAGGSSSTAGFTTSGNYWEYLAFNRSNVNAGFMWFTDNKLYRTINLAAASPTWTNVFTFTQPVVAMHSCIADINKLYVITNDGKIQVSSNAMDAAPTFTTYNLPSVSNSIASIAAMANNANTVYVSINNKVYFSTDAGATFTNITYNLPNVNHRKILAEEFGGAQELIFIATNNAVYYKKAGQTVWTNYSTNLPGRRAPTDFSMYDDGTNQALIRFYTYGRSVWETPFNNLRALSTKIIVGAEFNPTCSTHTVSFSENSLGNPLTYQWIFDGASPSTSSSATPTVTYTANGTYNVTLTITDAIGNTSTQTISKTIQLIPTVSSAVTITTNPTTPNFCLGDNISLTASGGIAPTFVTSGNGASVSAGSSGSSTLGPNPLQNYYGGSKQLMLFTAQELNDIGLTTGAQIDGFGVNIAAANTSYVLQNVQVKIQTTNLTTLTSFINTGWMIVRPAANYTISAIGWNTIPFTTNYNWDGSSNLLVEITYSNNNAGSSGNTALYGNTTNTSTLMYRADNATAASIDTYSGTPTYTYNARNNVRFTLGNNVVTYTWLPTIGLNIATGNTVVASPIATTTYSVSASAIGRCPVSVSQIVTLKTFTVVSSTGTNGSISPNGNTTINCGTNQLYTCVPSVGFVVDDVLVDGISQGGLASFTFLNVSTAHTIAVSFKPACLPNTWIGAISTAWNVPTNWDCGVVPAAGANITINNVPNKPVLNADVTIGNLTLAAGTTLTVGNHSITLNGILTGLGTLSCNNGSNIFTNANTSLLFTMGANTIKNLTVNAGTTTLSNALNITAGVIANSFGTITVANGASLVSNGNLTLQSNINGTARVDKGAITGNYIIGDVTVERYIPANTKRAWRLLSVPTLGSQTIQTAWQENQLPTVNSNLGYGTFITSNISSTSALYAAGFDYFTTSGSMQKYNSAAQRWDYITTTNTDVLQTNKAYFIYIRGDRTVTPSSSVASLVPTTLRTKGTLYQGDLTTQTINVGVNKFEPVGNLYASTIDFTGLSKTGGISSTFYIWDPKAGSTSVLGAYQTFNPLNNYKPFLPGSYGTANGGADPFRSNTLIESGQGFIVTSSGTAGSITLVENAKTQGVGQQVFRPTNNISKIQTSLLKVNGSTSKLVDGNLVAFNAAYIDGIDDMDAKKIANNGENFSINYNENNWVVDARNKLNDSTVIQYNIWNLVEATHYELNFKCNSFLNTLYTPVLIDNYLSTNTPIMLNEVVYPFYVDANPLSKVKDRFKVVFNRKILSISIAKFIVTPNPTEGNILNILFNNQPSGSYKIRLISNDGSVVQVFNINHIETSKSHSLILLNKLAAGLYHVEITQANKLQAILGVQVSR